MDILPDASPELIIHLQSPPFAELDDGTWQQQERQFLYCAAHRPLRLSLRAPMKLFAVRFRPWGVYRFAKVSMQNVLDRPVSATQILGNLGTALVSGLNSASTDAERVNLADQLFQEAVAKTSVVDAKLKRLLDASNGGRSSSSDIARDLAVSNRTFRRLWKEVVGIPSSKFIQLMRFHQALEMIAEGMTLSQVAAECGYSDQAHMARQIKSIAGLPASALKRRLGSDVYHDLYSSRAQAPWRDRRESKRPP